MHKLKAIYVSGSFGGVIRSWCDGALVDDGDDGTEGEPGDEVSFGEVAMEKQSLWSGFVNL